MPVSERISFRRLSHAFTVRCDDPDIGRYVCRVLDRFRVPAGSTDGTSYEVLDLGEGETQSRFRLQIDGAWVLGSGNPAHILDDLFSHVNVDTIEATVDSVLIHAGAVVTPDALGVVLPASSGSGKSTLVAGLVRAGFGYLSDEAAVLDPVSALLHPYPIHLSLKAASRDRFPEARPGEADLAFCDATWHVDPDAIRPGAVARPCEVGFVIAHRFEPGAGTVLEPLSPAAACVELVRNQMHARRDMERSLDLLAGICRASRCFRLTHGDLDEAVEAIASLTGA